MNQQENSTHEFTIYSRILGKSAPLPVILAILLGVTPFLDVSLGGAEGLIKLVIWVLAGVIYVSNFMPSGEKISYINMGFNAAILAGIADLLGELVYWISLSVRQGYGYSSSSASAITTSLFQAIIVGALTAVAWLFYKTNQKT